MTGPVEDSKAGIKMHGPEPVPTQLFIAGQWRAAQSGDVFPVLDPATGQVIARVADGGAADALEALAAADAAAAGWAAAAPRDRGEILRRAFDALMSRRDEFARLMTLEMGKPYAEALGEVTYGGEFLRWFGEEAPRVAGRYGSNPEGTGQMVVSHRPVGPCYLVTPWNFPLAMATRKIAPALAAGCTAVLKPAELTPLTALLLADLLREAGVPDGVLNIVTTTQPGAVSDVLLADRRLRKISFTGSTEVGKALMAKASAGVLRMSMELGGNAPFLVFDDADLDASVDGAMAAKFRNIGQTCTAANRFIVHSSIADEFTARVTERVNALEVGSGLDPLTTVGPLISDRAVDGVDALVKDATSRGAVIAVGGHAIDGAGSFYSPTVLSGVQPGSDILVKEIFGPVLAISTFSSEAEAVRLANDTDFGLVSYVFTSDVDRVHRLIDSLETGMMGVNTGIVSNAAAPFGGVKQSGIGREGGVEGIQEYLASKYTLIGLGAGGV